MKKVKNLATIVGIFLLVAYPCHAGPKPVGEFIMSSIDDEIKDLGTPSQSADTPLSRLSEINLDGQGDGTLNDIYSSDGHLEIDSPFSYTVASSGMLKIFPAPPSDSILNGIVSPDASIFGIVDTKFDHPGFHIGIKKSSGMSNASLNGDYIISDFSDEITSLPLEGQSADEPFAAHARVISNGDGTGTHQNLTVSDGTPPFPIDDINYSVDTDGFLTLNPEPGVPTEWHGMVSADGSVFTITKEDADEPGIVIGIRKSSGMSNASTKGTYLMCEFTDDIDDLDLPSQSADDPYTGLMEIKMDGEGNGTFRRLYASSSDSESGTFTYSITSDGVLTVTPPDAIIVNGIVSADGHIFTLVQTRPDNPGIIFGIKKSPTASPSLPLLLLGD